MKAFLLVGTPSSNSRTLALVTAIADELELIGHEPVIWDLSERPLPVFESPFHSDQGKVGEAAREFLNELNESSMVVFATPLYHGSYSSTIKNAIDYLLKDQLEDKPVGLVCHGGITKAMQAVGHMVQITQTLYGVPMQTQIATSGEHYDQEDEGFVLTDSETGVRVKRLVAELDKYSELLRS